MSGSHLRSQSLLVDNVSWQQQLQRLNFSNFIFTFIYLHKKASVDLRMIIETQLIPRLQKGSFCVINCCNQRFSTSFGDQQRNGSVYQRPQPIEELRFSEFLRQDSVTDLPVLRKISAKEEALVIQLDITQIYSKFCD